MEKEIDVVGIGNAIVDVLTQVEEEFLEVYNLKKGSMTLIDEKIAKELYLKIKINEEISGGSAANTIAGLASLGKKTAFIGKVSNDSLGNSFDYGLSCIGVKCSAIKEDNGPSTARCIILVTPDAQRTMCTFLGVAGELNLNDIRINKDIIANSKILYLEGYLWDKPHAKVAIREAIKIAKENKAKVAFSLSDSFCVQRHKEEFLELIKNDLDIIFANENEIISLFEKKDFDSTIYDCINHDAIWALTRSEKGSTIIFKNEIHQIGIEKVENLIDTTGAGDLYAAGFLNGYLENKDLKTCGIMGSIAAAEIISHFGARPKVSLTELFKKKNL